MRKTNPQLVADKENQDRPERGKNEAGGMVSFVCRPRKYVGDGAADDRSNDAEHNRPEIVMWVCMTDFAIAPAINPTRIYQIK